MKPKYLEKNGKIFFIAPSFGVTTFPYNERFKKAVENFKMLGYELAIGPNVYKNEGCAGSNTPELRAKEFMDAYESDANAIISVGGGETMCEILPYVDFERIKTLPTKWYMGYSDNTNLTYTLTTICDIETIYGQCAGAFYSYPFEYDAKESYEILLGKREFKGFDGFTLRDTHDVAFPKYSFEMKKEIIPINYSKPFEGILIGGCLDCLINLCGTKFDNTLNYINKHKKDGIIFFLEACELTSIGIRRAMFQLKSAGWFDNVNGFIIGRSMLYNDYSFDNKPQDSYASILKDLNVPILLDIDLGHISPALPIRCGAKAKIEYKDNNIFITYNE